MKELKTWLDEAKAAGTRSVFISFHAPAFCSSGMGPLRHLGILEPSLIRNAAAKIFGSAALCFYETAIFKMKRPRSADSR